MGVSGGVSVWAEELEKKSDQSFNYVCACPW